jgi:molybdate transport system substrate-binding protein
MPARFITLIAAVLAFVASTAQAERITVFAASSLKNALEEIAAEFDADTGHKTLLSFAGSSALARQIQLGAPADVFISASPDWMDLLEQGGEIDAASRFDLLENDLVLIAPAGTPAEVDLQNPAQLEQLIGDTLLSMALVEAVPAGIYGKAALVSLGLWDRVAPNVVQTSNVRAALALVSLGEVPFGIVYASDALADPRVTRVGAFPTDTHPDIVYPAARVQSSKVPAAQDFLNYLATPDSERIFENHGFQIPQRPQ